MSDLSPLSGEERKSNFGAVRSVFDPRLCENSDVGLARRKFVSITLNKKRTALAVTVERRKERKQFCVFLARASFHTAWVNNGPDGPEIRLPLFPQKRVESDIGPCPVRANFSREPPFLLLGLSYMRDLPP